MKNVNKNIESDCCIEESNNQQQQSLLLKKTSNGIKRTYKTIGPERILDISKLDIIPLGTDEIFVKLDEYVNFWISNYGRGLTRSGGKYRFVKGYKSSGRLIYILQKYATPDKDERKVIWTSENVATLVVKLFIDYPYEKRKVYIWHSDNNLDDFYYRNLYPLPVKEYNAVKNFYKLNGYDSEEIILNIMDYEVYFSHRVKDDYYKPTVSGVGYWGVPSVDIYSRTYITWSNMLRRCYNKKNCIRWPSYRNCTVYEDWKNYSVFKEWVENNFYQVGDERMELDKDILVKGNKVYGPDTCCFVPQSINVLFVKNDTNRGELPIGVTKVNNGYQAIMSYFNKNIKIGTYDTPEEAFEKYKEYKEKFIKNIANRYKDRIPDKLYQAMMRWEVEITD